MGKENVFFGIDDYMALYSPYIKRKGTGSIWRSGEIVWINPW